MIFIEGSRPLSLQRPADRDARGERLRTILLKGLHLFLCSDARGKKIEIARPGLRFGML